MSESNRVELRYVPEGTYGETPAAGTWQALRYTAETFSATPNTTTSAEVRSDRMVSDMPKVGLAVGGGFDLELSGGTYDELVEAVMCGTWNLDTPVAGTDTIKVGTVDRSFSIEKEFADLSPAQFLGYKGMRVGQMSLSLAYGSIITGSFAFAGNGAPDPTTTSLVGGGTETVATTTEVINASSDVGTISIDSTPTDICINSMTLDINNNLREITCIGSDAPQDQKKGTAAITGSVEMYLDANSLAQYGNALTNTSIELEYTVTDGTYSYTFLLPNIKLQGEAPQSGGLDTDVMFSANFTALYDATEGSSLTITRIQP